MSDGVTLRLNVFRPRDVAAPVVMSVTPYGKDKTPGRIGMLAMRLSGVRFGRLNRSPMTGFESPDPLFWVGHGYAVVQADARGMHSSEGTAGLLTDRDAADYAELVGWAADQPSCRSSSTSSAVRVDASSTDTSASCYTPLLHGSLHGPLNRHRLTRKYAGEAAFPIGVSDGTRTRDIQDHHLYA
jgi:X-Pro dipeptidyl-peptidase-like protein